MKAIEYAAKRSKTFKAGIEKLEERGYQVEVGDILDDGTFEVINGFVKRFDYESSVTPSNFYVRQAYPDYEPRRVTTKLLGDIIKPSLNEEVQGKYNNFRMVNAVAANFVHSLDATAMYKTINKALDRGVTAFCMIHDSYGTVAADTETLSKCTREAFVELYENQNYLESFLGQLGKVIPQRLRHKLPEVPELGTFNIKEVLESKHFFS